jgi:hypothetical protein
MTMMRTLFALLMALVMLLSLAQASYAAPHTQAPAASGTPMPAGTPVPLHPIFVSAVQMRAADGWNNQIGTFNGLPVVAPSGTPPSTMPCLVTVPPELGGTNAIIIDTAIPAAGTTNIPECGDSPANTGPLNPPCGYQGIIIGTPGGVVVGTPIVEPTYTHPITVVETSPTPPVTVPVCQWPAPTSSSCDGWQFTMPLNTSFCIPYKEWIKDVFFGVDQVLGGAVDYIAARVVTALTFTPPDIGAAVGSIYDTMNGLATEILLLLFTLEATRVVLSIVTSMHHGEALSALRRAIWALAMLQVLKPAMDAWIGSANAVAGAVVGNGTGGGAAGVLEALNLTAFLSQGAIVEVIFFVLAIAVAVLLVVITVQRLCGLFLLACLYAVAPACLACWIAPETRSIARWWFGSFLCYSLYGVAYAVMLSVDAALLTNVRSFSGDLLYQLLAGVAGYVVLLRVPAVMDTFQSGISSGAAGTMVINTIAAKAVSAAL